MNFTEVFNRATDGIEPAGLAGAAMTAARARQGRRRVILASAAAAAVIVTSGSVLASRDGDDSPSPSRNPQPTVTTTPSGFDPGAQRLWDPLTIEDAPARSSVLPDRLEPPDNPPTVARLPMDAAVVAWPEEGEDVRLLGTDGQWRCIDGTDDVAESTWWYSNPVLSSDGTQVAMSSKDGIVVVDVTTGDQEVIPWPDELHAPWDSAPEVRWLPGDAGFAVFFWNDNWVVDLAGDWKRPPFARAYSNSVAIDPNGAIIQHQWRVDELVEWDGDDVVRRVPFPYQGQRYVSGFGQIAYTTGSLGDIDGHLASGPVAADPATGDLLAFRPIRDPHATYSDNGYLTAMGFLDADTVVYLVGPARQVDRQLIVDAWHLVAWDVDTGEFERLTTGSDGMRTIDVAVGVLADE